MFKYLTATLNASLVSVVFVLASQSAAVSATCSAYIANSFTVNPTGSVSTCFVDTIGNNDSAGQLNAQSLFSSSDWTQIARDNDVDGVDTGTAGAFTFTGGTIATDGDPKTDTSAWSVEGTWSLVNSLVAAYEKVAFVFKDGNGTPDSWVAFLIELSDGATTTGTYRSLFLNIKDTKNPIEYAPKNISHISLYVAGEREVSTVPLPAALPLFGAVIGALGVAGVYRRRQSTSKSAA